MKHPRVSAFLGLVSLFCGVAVQAQPAVARQAVAAEPQAAAVSGPAPTASALRLVKFSGALKDRLGRPLTGVVGLTFALYKDQQGGAPLWLETQNAELDEQGRYAVLLGATKSEGLPLELFTSGEPRWLGVQVLLPGVEEEPRALLVSVPYALKAADAETLGGKPLGAFVLAEPEKGAATGEPTKGLQKGNGPVAANSGTVNYVGKFASNGVDLTNSLVYDNGTSVGIGTTAPAFPLHVVGPNQTIMRLQSTMAGATDTAFHLVTPDRVWSIGSDPGGIGVGKFGIFDGTAVANRLTIDTSGNVGIGTATPGAKLDVAGNVTVSGVFTGNGSGLTNLNAGNLSTGTIANSQTTATSLGTASTIVARDASGNFTAGMVTATQFSGGGAALTGVNAASLGSVAAANYARTDQGNSLTGTQQISGVVSVRNSTFEQLNLDTSGNLVALGSLYTGTGNFVTPSGSDLLVGQVTNGSTISNVFRVDSTGKGYFNGGTVTSGADFAESFAVQGRRENYEPADVLVIDPAGHRRLALSQSPYSTLVAGIYSTKPGVLATPYEMNHPNIDKEVPLAVVGVVPCKVSDENGPIAVGDLLVTSSTPGHAMRGADRGRMLGAVVGKALEPLASGKGVIQVLVTLQ